MAIKYVCDQCRKEFKSDWTEEEAEAEKELTKTWRQNEYEV